jgi:hypothetical protein
LELEVAHRAGHARTSESLDTYSHVMPLDEMPSERVEGLFSNVVGGRFAALVVSRWCLGRENGPKTRIGGGGVVVSPL